MVNVVVLDGTLGRDAEAKYTTTGKPVTNFSLAVDNGWGENKKDPFWFNVVCWQDLAEEAGKLTKGAKVTVYGRLTTRKYKNKQDVDVTITEIVANALSFRNSERKADNRANASSTNRAQAQEIPDQDIPF